MTSHRRFCPVVVDRDGRVCNKRLKIDLGSAVDLEGFRRLDCKDDLRPDGVAVYCLDGHLIEGVLACRVAA